MCDSVYFVQQHYAQFVISIMAKMCAPVRDEKIKQLTETTDVVETFKGILEVCIKRALTYRPFVLTVKSSDAGFDETGYG